MFNFWCECVQCLRGGVRFPNEVGVWWPSVYGGPNPKALHFQPWVGLGLRSAGIAQPSREPGRSP